MRNAIPVEVLGTRGGLPHGLRKVLLDDFFLVVMVCGPPIIVFETVNEVLPSTVIDAEVKKASVSISLFEQRDSRALPFPCSFKNRQGQDFPFQLLSKVPLSRAECP